MSELVVALDVPSQREALALVDLLDDEVDFFKVGLELYTREGPGMIRALHGRGKRVFLDLKLFDIPTTVAKAVSAASSLDVELLTIHTTGGRSMMAAAVEAAGDDLSLLGVTVLTSFRESEVAEVWGRPVDAVAPEVERLARLAREVRVPGVVASAGEAARLRAALGPDALIVTPGIRLPSDDVGDQVRVATPESAVADGATHLVVGRPIREAEDPAAAARTFLEAIRAAGGSGGGRRVKFHAVFPWTRPLGGVAVACLVSVLVAAPVTSQTPDDAARGFAEAWASGGAAQLRARFAESVRLTLDGRSRTGVRPEQTVAALTPLLDRFEGPTPVVVRAEPMGPDGESGFAELRWDARFRDSGTLRVHTLLVTFIRVGGRLLVSDLRIVV